MSVRNKGITHYSLKIEGAPCNYRWSVQFDITDGIVGIDQYVDGELKDRVLLTDMQVKELIAFVRRNGGK